MSVSDKGTTPATNNQTSTNTPWSGVLPYLNQGLAGAQDLYQSGGAQYYPGQTYAGTNPALDSGMDQLNGIQSQFAPTQQAAQGAIGGAINAGQNVGNQVQDIANGTTSDNPSASFFGDVMNGSQGANNPYFQQMSDTIKAQVQPGIQAQFANAGRGVSGLAGRAVGEGLGDSIGALAYDNYNQNLARENNAATSLSGIYNSNIQNRLAAGNQQLAGGNLALQGAQLAPAIQNMGINAGNASLLAGTTAQGIQQGALTDAQNRYNYGQNLPQQNLQNFIRNITGQSQGNGSTTSTGTQAPAQASFFNQLLGGGLAASSFFT